MATPHGDLLERYQPLLRYDSNEAFFADAAAIFTDNPASVLRRASAPDGTLGEVLAVAPPRGDLSLAFLEHPVYADGEEHRRGDHLSVLNRDYRAQATALHMRREYANVMYGRAQRERTSEGRLWLQYWLFYFFNDYQLAGGIGLHEGDWEMVQLRLHGDVPDLAAYCQHRYAETRHWKDVEREGDAPIVYVARGSHAAYFTSGLHRTEAWFDLADGGRPTPRLRLELLGEEAPAWTTWPGRWGDTRPRFAGIDTPSPDGPAAHGQWEDPAVLLRHDTEDREHGPAPPAPAVRVRRDQGRLRIDYDHSALGPTAPVPDRLIVTVNSRDERLAPTGAHRRPTRSSSTKRCAGTSSPAVAWRTPSTTTYRSARCCSPGIRARACPPPPSASSCRRSATARVGSVPCWERSPTSPSTCAGGAGDDRPTDHEEQTCRAPKSPLTSQPSPRLPSPARRGRR